MLYRLKLILDSNQGRALFRQKQTLDLIDRKIEQQWRFLYSIT